MLNHYLSCLLGPSLVSQWIVLIVPPAFTQNVFPPSSPYYKGVHVRSPTFQVKRSISFSREGMAFANTLYPICADAGLDEMLQKYTQEILELTIWEAYSWCLSGWFMPPAAQLLMSWSHTQGGKLTICKMRAVNTESCFSFSNLSVITVFVTDGQ